MGDKNAMTRPHISVVMPNYNHGRFIGQALMAVLSQTCQADEIIVVDDASTDDSIEIVKKLTQNQSNVSLICRSTRGGAASALNEGLEQATGELICFPAADDVLGPEFLAETSTLMHRFSDAPFCSACVELVNSENRGLGERPILQPIRTSSYATASSARAMLAHGDNFFLGHVTLYRRDRLLELGGFDAKLGSATDGILQRRLAVRWGFCFIPKVLGIWRIHGANYSVGSVTDPDKLNDLIEQCRRVIDREPSGLFPDHYGQLLERRMRFYAARQALLLNDRKPPSDEALQTICALSQATELDRTALQLMRHLGSASLSLAWLAMRLRPLSFSWFVRERLHRAIDGGPRLV